MDFKRFFEFTSLFLLALLLVFVQPALSQSSGKVKTPEEQFGFKPGADRMMFDYEQLIDYLKILEKQSPMIKLQEIGESPLGKKMYIAFISSADNINNLDTYREINKELALNTNLPEEKLNELVGMGKVFFLATLSMHSSEVGPTQAAPLIAYKLITTDDPEIKSWLDDVVYMMVPCHNPDGMDMIVHNYNKYKGTKYEGSFYPGVYHKYVGHDNNRDFVTLTQKDTKAINWIWSKGWFPQVMIEKHQMYYDDARYSVPPPHDPISENIDSELWNWIWIFGSNMTRDMVSENLSGVVQHYLFDDYWTGSTETCIWKNVIGFLSEAASVHVAKPIFIEPNELKVSGKGLSEYAKGINMTLPWPGGWWRLGDIVKYEISSTLSIIKTASLHREDILKFRNYIAQRDVKNGKENPPYYYILPKNEQHDQGEFVNLINLMTEHGISIYELTAPATIDGKTYNEGDIVIPLAQPFRAFIKETMEAQAYPVRRYTPDGPIIKPYEISSWSLPLHMGVNAIEIKNTSSINNSLLKELKSTYNLEKNSPEIFKGLIYSCNNNAAYKALFLANQIGVKVQTIDKEIIVDDKMVPIGSFYIPYNQADLKKIQRIVQEINIPPIVDTIGISDVGNEIKIPKIALVETYYHDMDSGWTRYLFDSYYIQYDVLHPIDIAKKGILDKYGLLIFTDTNAEALKYGKVTYGSYSFTINMPPEYMGSMGDEGVQNLLNFIENGGRVISWGDSTKLFMGTLTLKKDKNTTETYTLPINDISKEITAKGFYCPGSFISLKLNTDNPFAYGMPEDTGGFFTGEVMFKTSIPEFDMDRRAIATFSKKDILKSGYCEKEELISGQTGMVWLKKAKGDLILFSFKPQFRASTQVTYKLLFNSIIR